MSSFLKTLTEPPCSLEHLKDRTREEGECWNWTAAYRHNRWPTIAFRRNWDGTGSGNKVFYVRHVMYWHRYGKPPELGKYRVLVPKCGNQDCVNPDHLLMQTRAQLAKKLAAAGHYKSMTRRMKLAESKRKTSKLSDEAVAEIRLPDSKAAAMAAKHGISVAYAYMIRNGEWRRDYSNPFAALMTG
jgi:hypothetical protein